MAGHVFLTDAGCQALGMAPHFCAALLGVPVNILCFVLGFGRVTWKQQSDPSGSRLYNLPLSPEAAFSLFS